VSVAVRNPRLVDILRRSVLFADWPPEALAAAAQRLRPLSVPAGHVCLTEGQPGDEMYLVDEGQFVVESSSGGKLKQLAQLGPGAVFGEMAVLTGQPRSARVTAQTDARIWALSREDFQQLVRLQPELSARVAQIVSDRQGEDARRVANERLTLLPLLDGREQVSIGRSSANDIALAHPNVSRVHAVLQRAGDSYRIVDMRSTNGTFVNGERVRTRLLRDGDEIWIGSTVLVFDRSAITHFSRGGGLQIDAIGLSRTVGQNLTILDDITLSVYPGELVCIVGGSGAGKTTLLDALSGYRPATAGRVHYNGLDFYGHFAAFRQSLGYVPQDDIVHPELTVYQTLYFTARLRLPTDTTRAEIERRITEVLENLDLTERRDTEVRKLSGGQRKRVSIGVELLTKPDVFFLDEPTSGLDPGLDSRMMDLLRKIASQGRTIVLTTHATRNIMICDYVIFMARGGRLAYFGPPADALEYFGVENFADIYRLLEDQDSPEGWQAKFRRDPRYSRDVGQRLAAPRGGADGAREPVKRDRPASASWPRQLFWLTLRYLLILRGDLVSLLVLLLAAPFIGLMLSSAFRRSVFAMTWADGGDARQGVALMFLLGSASIFLGAFVAARSIAEEVRIYARERLVNLKIAPYILSKLATLGIFSLIQSALLLAIVSRHVDFPGDTETLLALYGTLALTNITAVGMGLLVSAIAANGLQATLVMVLLLVPQLILSGSVVPLGQLNFGPKLASHLIIGRWSLSLLGYFADLNARLGAQLPRNDYAEQFDIDPQVHALALVGLLTAFIVGAVIALRQKEVR
jgi:ABC-type multidrug transport system ATPase subunit/ABC-type multidrug transport system permease subunit